MATENEFCTVCNKATFGELTGLRMQTNGNNLMKDFDGEGAGFLVALMCRNCYAKVAKAVQKIIK